MTISAEDRLIAWLRGELGRRDCPDLLGSDVAQLALTGDWAISVDQQIEGVHFPTGLPARRIARKLVAVNLSDLAAAGAEPRYALSALAAPANFDHKSFFRGLLDTAAAHGLALAGGDLSRSDRLHATLTVLGKRRTRARLLRRDLARPGDLLWLGGGVGESAAGKLLLERGAEVTASALRPPAGLRGGVERAARAALLRHLAPEPQLELGAWLSRRRRAAAIDVSDGLLLDLERLARASDVRCEIDAHRLPTSPGFSDLASALEMNATTLALTGGEDYVLLFSIPHRCVPPAELGAVRIGRVLAQRRGTRKPLVTLRGAELPAGAPRGWDHLT